MCLISPQVSIVETVVGEILGMTSSMVSDKLMLYALSRDSRKKWRVTAIDAASTIRKKLILVDDVMQVENNDLEMTLTADKKYLVLKVSLGKHSDD